MLATETAMATLLNGMNGPFELKLQAGHALFNISQQEGSDGVLNSLAPLVLKMFVGLMSGEFTPHHSATLFQGCVAPLRCQWFAVSQSGLQRAPRYLSHSFALICCRLFPH